MAAELRRLGQEKRLIIAAHVRASNPDPVLIKAIARAHRWFNLLKERTVGSISELAKAEHVPRTYVRSVIPLALLAPDITEAIINVTPPIVLKLDQLGHAKLQRQCADTATYHGSTRAGAGATHTPHGQANAGR